MKALFFFAAMMTLATPAAAEVTERHADGFTTTRTVTLEAPSEEILQAIGQVADWWDGAHTYTGSSDYLYLSLEPGACFCERFPDGGGAEHGRVVFVGPAMVRLYAALGPLQDRAPNSVLTFEIKDHAETGGTGRELSFTYVVSGRGMGALADAVDGMMTGQFDRLVRWIETGEREPASR